MHSRFSTCWWPGAIGWYVKHNLITAGHAFMGVQILQSKRSFLHFASRAELLNSESLCMLHAVALSVLIHSNPQPALQCEERISRCYDSVFTKAQNLIDLSRAAGMGARGNIEFLSFYWNETGPIFDTPRTLFEVGSRNLRKTVWRRSG